MPAACSMEMHHLLICYFLFHRAQQKLETLDCKQEVNFKGTRTVRTCANSCVTTRMIAQFESSCFSIADYFEKTKSASFRLHH